MANIRKFFPVGLCALVLLVSSCSLPGLSPGDSGTGSTADTDWSVGGDTDSGTGMDSATGAVSDMGGSGSVQAVNVEAGAEEDVRLDLQVGSGTLMIDSGTGARINVLVDSAGSGTLTAAIRTSDPAGNIRISQVVMPDGTADGPFGGDLTYALTQSGTYRIVLSANQMAGDPWAGESELRVNIR